jgi:hypothetical protein
MLQVISPAINRPNKQKKQFKLLIYKILKLNSNRRPKTKKVDISVNLFLKVARRTVRNTLIIITINL